MDLKRYTFKEFLSLSDESIIDSYLFVLEALKPLKTLNKKPLKELINLSFGEVINAKLILTQPTKEGLVELIKMVSNLKKKQIYDLSIYDFYGVLNNLKEQVITINEMEENNLVSKHTSIEWEMVDGSKRLSKYGVLNTIDKLAKGDILKYEQIEKLPYQLVLSKLMMDMEKSDIEADINNIKMKKIA
ncbi:hypothetical protein [Galbibacter pacificus]|uniref:Uncharacterized protein n=1 Tax=Galbibacter pacificus TaxID=2996052 RepID=A0ABT6FR75_9FLAO|nr:hypothetical protein [Galbibacter pacificus]MDG3581760.1 hypothetical protein [Galbibacter pacificus]MDG3585766.1 hypothetical protein [Galbibacter pacificus]